MRFAQNIEQHFGKHVKRLIVVTIVSGFQTYADYLKILRYHLPSVDEEMATNSYSKYIEWEVDQRLTDMSIDDLGYLVQAFIRMPTIRSIETADCLRRSWSLCGPLQPFQSTQFLTKDQTGLPVLSPECGWYQGEECLGDQTLHYPQFILQALFITGHMVEDFRARHSDSFISKEMKLCDRGNLAQRDITRTLGVFKPCGALTLAYRHTRWMTLYQLLRPT